MPQRAVYKTTNAEYLDRVSVNPAVLADALERLSGSASLVDRAQELEGTTDLPSGSVTDFINFIQQKGEGTFEQVVRLGYRDAIELALSRDQPIETFWVTSAGPDVEVHICEGRDSVLVFLFIPDEEGRPYGSFRAESRSWVVRAGDRVDVDLDVTRETLEDRVVKIQTSGPRG
jgi:hypothetical protein